VEFDESNGSQGKFVGYDLVGDEEVQEALKICLLKISSTSWRSFYIIYHSIHEA
jgi:hypothetical protein